MKSGRFLVALLISTGILGVLIDGSAFYSHLLYLGSILLIAAWIWGRSVSTSITLIRKSRTKRASLGEVFLEQYEVFNHGWLTAPWIEIVNSSSMPYSSGSRSLTMLYPYQHRSYLSRTWLTRRGNFHLGPTRITTGDPFGLFRFIKIITSTQSLVVLPMIFEIGSILSLPGMMPGGEVIRRKAIDINPNASGVREYAAGDPLKRIHWPTSKRHNKLMVKEFEQDPQGEVWLILDAQQGIHKDQAVTYDYDSQDVFFLGRRPKFELPPSTLEYAVSIVASLTHFYIFSRRAVGFLTEGRTYTVIPADKNIRQENKILETLAYLESIGSLTLAELASTQSGQYPPGSSVFFITPLVDEKLVITMDYFQRRNLQPVVIFISPEKFGGRPQDLHTLESIRSLSIPICNVGYGDNIGFALSGFKPIQLSSEYGVWQKPPLRHLI